MLWAVLISIVVIIFSKLFHYVYSKGLELPFYNSERKVIALIGRRLEYDDRVSGELLQRMWFVGNYATRYPNAIVMFIAARNAQKRANMCEAIYKVWVTWKHNNTVIMHAISKTTYQSLLAIKEESSTSDVIIVTSDYNVARVCWIAKRLQIPCDVVGITTHWLLIKTVSESVFLIGDAVHILWVNLKGAII